MSKVASNCNKCGNHGDKRCKNCKSVVYCSRECQVSDWKDGHRAICAEKRPALKPKQISKEQNIGLIIKSQKSAENNKEIVDRIADLKTQIAQAEEERLENAEELRPLNLVNFLDAFLKVNEDPVTFVVTELDTVDKLEAFWREMVQNIVDSAESEDFAAFVLDLENERLTLEQEFEVAIPLPPKLMFDDSILEALIDNDGLEAVAALLIQPWNVVSVPQKTTLKQLIPRFNPFIGFMPDQLVLIARKYDDPDYIKLIVELYGENSLPLVLIEGRLSPENGRLSQDTEFPTVLRLMLELGWKSKNDKLDWRNPGHTLLLWTARVDPNTKKIVFIDLNKSNDPAKNFDPVVKFNRDPTELLELKGILKNSVLLNEFLLSANSRKQKDPNDNPINWSVSPLLNLSPYLVAVENFYADSIPILEAFNTSPDSGVNIVSGEKKQTALHVLAQKQLLIDLNTSSVQQEKSSETMPKLLAVRGIDIVKKDTDGNTPMHLAFDLDVVSPLLEKLTREQLNLINNAGQTVLQELENRQRLAKENADLSKEKKQSILLNSERVLQSVRRKLGVPPPKDDDSMNDDDDDNDVEDKKDDSMQVDNFTIQQINAKLEDVRTRKFQIDDEINALKKELEDLERELADDADELKSLTNDMIWLQVLKTNVVKSSVPPESPGQSSSSSSSGDVEQLVNLNDYNTVLEVLRNVDPVEENHPFAYELIKYLPGGPYSQFEKGFESSSDLTKSVSEKPMFTLPEVATIRPDLAYALLQNSLQDDFKTFDLNAHPLKDYENVTSWPIAYERVIDTAMRFNDQFARMLTRQAREYHKTFHSQRLFEDEIGASAHLVKSNFNIFFNFFSPWFQTDVMSEQYAAILKTQFENGIASLSESEKKIRLRLFSESILLSNSEKDLEMVKKLISNRAFSLQNTDGSSSVNSQSRKSSILNLLFDKLNQRLDAAEVFSTGKKNKKIISDVYVLFATNLDFDWKRLLFPFDAIKFESEVVFNIVVQTEGGDMNRFRDTENPGNWTVLQAWAFSPLVSRTLFSLLLNLRVSPESDAAAGFIPFNPLVLTTAESNSRIAANSNLIHLASANVTSGHLALRAIEDNFKTEFSPAMLNAKNSQGQTPLHTAVGKSKNADKRTKILISLRADLNIKDNEGNTALHIAAANSLPATKILLEAGADKTIANNDGKLASEKSKDRRIRDLFSSLDTKKRGIDEVDPTTEDDDEDDDDITDEERAKRRRRAEELAFIISQLKLVEF